MFSDEADGAAERHAAPGMQWKLLIVDDEPEVHSITRLVLADFAFKNRPVAFYSAYSAAEAIEFLKREQDVAVILLDVVMESDDAGLKLVHHIREVLGNRQVRIILRTGQPGQAPERAVILGYDINDYKAKTQLTAQQLFTCTVAALRSYEDITTIEANRRGLEKIIEASSSLFRAPSMKLFAVGVLTQLSAIVGSGPDAILCVQRGPILGTGADGIFVLAGSGRFEALINEPVADHVERDVLDVILRCLERRRNIFEADWCALYIRTPNDRENVVYLKSDRPLNGIDQRLIELFCVRISVGFDNLHRYEQLLKAQEATLAAFADAAEPAGDCGGETILRVADLAERIALALRDQGQCIGVIDETFLEWLRAGAILHDIGHFSIGEGVLSKHGPLDPVERQAMQNHTEAGAARIERARMRAPGPNYLELASEIAQCHHENFDGTGYPDGLAGERIPLAARIVAIADTFVGLTTPRPHRPPFSGGDAVALVREQSGRRFDPMVVAAFLKVAAVGAV
ncbi:MAG: DUF3369 domain-containing protein [Azospirillum sp.]|nr:DUF3369 domain-containing protein [Azospirillum sp.]